MGSLAAEIWNVEIWIHVVPERDCMYVIGDRKEYENATLGYDISNNIVPATPLEGDVSQNPQTWDIIS